jgi:hypothetical protein
MGPIDLWPELPFAWRPPSLRQLIRQPGFREVREHAAAWMNQRVAVLHEPLPWLEHADGTVTDFCSVGAAQFTHRARLSRKLVLCRGPKPPVTCWREVTVAYGFEGPRAERLAELIAVLQVDGWADWKHWFTGQEITRAWLEAAGHDNSLRASWRYRPGLEPPPVLQDDDPELHFSHKPTPGLRMRWMSSSEPDAQAGAFARDDGPLLSAGNFRSWPFRPAQVICPPYRGNVTGLAGPVLACREHALVISLVLGYYQNDDARTPPGRLRKQLLPVLW